MILWDLLKWMKFDTHAELNGSNYRKLW